MDFATGTRKKRVLSSEGALDAVVTDRVPISVQWKWRVAIDGRRRWEGDVPTVKIERSHPGSRGVQAHWWDKSDMDFVRKQCEMAVKRLNGMRLPIGASGGFGARGLGCQLNCSGDLRGDAAISVYDREQLQWRGWYRLPGKSVVDIIVEPELSATIGDKRGTDKYRSA